MSLQMVDLFLWEGEEWAYFSCTSNYKLFEIYDPKKYGLFEPEVYNLDVITTMSGCIQGYVVQYAVKENKLFLENLWVNCRNDVYPEINEVKAIKLAVSSNNLYIGDYPLGVFNSYMYKNISERLYFCGKIKIAKEPSIVEIRGIPVYAFRKVYELVFENGVLQNFSDISDISKES